jgi:hypothetical protein
MRSTLKTGLVIFLIAAATVILLETSSPQFQNEHKDDIPNLIADAPAWRNGEPLMADASTKSPKNVFCDPKQGPRFVKYVSSTLEREWNVSIAELREDWTNRGCVKIVNDAPRYSSWFAASASTQPTSVSEDEDVISYHVFYDPCRTGNPLIKIGIEPIMGLLRHPNAICTSSSDPEVVRKDWIILPHASNLPIHTGRALLYDVGASLFVKGSGGASQEWFVNEFAARGIPFDHIYAWEAEKYEAPDIFKDVPKEILHKLSYYNVPVEEAADALHNPIRVIKASAKAEDYVVLKLDIDTPWLELSIMRQLLDDDDARSLVDELFFEHHTGGTPMLFFWGAKFLGDVTDSYSLFTELRMKGIRAHSWV